MGLKTLIPADEVVLIGKVFVDTGRDDGFTLIEFLVGIIVIGILAAIAIPVFLNQGDGGLRPVGSPG